ncbi:hypothetical protein QYM36_005231 [Artemia franciscana]|uniref:GPI ethanolamine phosphate transferase 1 n=1 Tax=Artemia franciscana TaxID=6661 RepID=A0AA88HWZ2_ARTSF|nr:hypothetical protein QYM36_005231 [Artemia franciscana]
MLILISLIIHILFLAVSFDIHFTSPVVQNVSSHSWKKTGEAKRLVLIIADGLRFDTFWKANTLHLHNIGTTRGVWGRSRTQLPTESRTGHVAVIGGFYEDPSAIFKGWKENPVDFDSVFNRSRYTWSWGSPDILRIFSKGHNVDHIFTDSYSPEDEDFTGTNAYKLDEWVFIKFKDFLSSAQKNATLQQMVRRDKVVFFLHLLGLDTNGHSKKPHSREYLENLRFVDDHVKELEDQVNNFYGDNATAFLFTSDHGMTDWGSHGAGDPSETDTPFVAWGAGFYKPKIPSLSLHSVRRDCNQVDLTPLMSAVLGINFPVNSKGFLRAEHLVDDMKYRAIAMLGNAEQMYEQFKSLEEKKKATTYSFTFSAYPPLADSHYAVTDVQNLIDRGFYKQAIEAGEELHLISSSGIDYYHRYDSLWLYSVATLGFIGWIAYTLHCIILGNVKMTPNRNIQLIFVALGVFQALYLFCK